MMKMLNDVKDRVTPGRGGGGGGGGAGPSGRLRWMPARRPDSARDGYARAGTDEEHLSRMPGRYEVASSDQASSQEGSLVGGYGVEDASLGIGLSVVVPKGGEHAFRVATPSGAQIVVPLPEGTAAGDSVEFELSSLQLGELPRSDLAALRDGRYVVEPGAGDD